MTRCRPERATRLGLMSRALLLLASGGALGASAAAQQAVPTPIAAADLMRHASVLAADSMEGRLVGSPGGARARAYLVRTLTAAGLQPIGANLEVPFAVVNPRDSSLRRGVNVVGLVRGTRNPDRYIVVTAHYDHVGVRQGEIYNGADDNASGTSALVEIARQFIASPPAWTARKEA
jgi:Zn-dependent M28 family amino/carboxypeptidase